MSNNIELLKVINKNNEVIDTCFYTYFKNNKYEEEYNNFKYKFHLKLRLTSSVLIIVYSLIISISFLINKGVLYGSIIQFGVFLFNFISIIIIYKTPMSSKLNIALSYLKLILNIINYSFFILFNMLLTSNYTAEEFISNKIEVILEYTFITNAIVRNIHLTIFLIVIEYGFFIKSSKKISFSILAWYIIICIIGSLFNKLDPFYLKYEFLSLVFFTLFFLIPDIIWNSKREQFISFKNTETINNYYESLINNMQIQVVSLFNKKSIMYNSSFSNQINTRKQSLNIDKITSNNLIDKVDILSIKKDKLNDFDINAYLECLIKIEDEKLSLLEIINNLSNGKAEIKENNSNFKSLGTFITKDNENRFYEVYSRLFDINDENNSKYIVDIYINEITEILTAENLLTETKLKQKLFSKFAHEFKTPIIIIKSLLSEINNNIEKY